MRPSAPTQWRPARDTILVLVLTGLLAGRPATVDSANDDTVTFIRLAGSWKVVRVDLNPSPVQALVKDDPQYMNAIVDITPARLSWRPGKNRSLSDICEEPKLASNSEINCGQGRFGFTGAKLRIVGEELRLEWYDNAILTLQRVSGAR
jgi:hypothetical protein